MTTELAKGLGAMMFRPQKPHERDEDYVQRVSHAMLTEQRDPLAAAAILLGRQHHEWTPLECAKFVLDYADWYDANLDAKDRGIWEHFKEKHAEEINQVIFITRRTEGQITSNPIEMRTFSGRDAADVGKFDPERRRRRGPPRWEGGVLKNAPFGYEEAVAKRQAFSVDDPDQGHLLIKQIDGDGQAKVKQIIPREEIKKLPSLFPELPDPYLDDPLDFDAGQSKKT